MSDQNQYKPSPEEVNKVTELCHLVGYCLLNFSNVEESLAELYGTAAGIEHMEVAFKTHDEIREFQYRLGTTDAVVRLWISKMQDEKDRAIFSKEWNALQRIIKEDSQDRNRIAHFSIGPETGTDGSTNWYVCPYFQFFSHLSYYSSGEGNRQLPPGIKKFDIKSMNAKARRFLNTGKRIDKFIGGLTTHGARLPKWP